MRLNISTSSEGMQIQIEIEARQRMIPAPFCVFIYRVRRQVSRLTEVKVSQRVLLSDSLVFNLKKKKKPILSLFFFSVTISNTSPATLHSWHGEWKHTEHSVSPLTVDSRGIHTHTHSLQKVRSQEAVSPACHQLAWTLQSLWSPRLLLNTEDGVQYIFSQFTLKGYICIGVQTKHLWSVVGWKTLWKQSRSSFWTTLLDHKIFLDRDDHDAFSLHSRWVSVNTEHTQ